MQEEKNNTRSERGISGSDQASGLQSKRAKSKSFQPPAQEDFANILERISDGFVAFDAQLNYTYVNQRGGELLGRKPEELIGNNYWVEYPEARGTPFADAYVRALETQEVTVIEDYYEPFDRWFENRMYPSKDGLSIFFTEITERKQTEEALQRSEERLRLSTELANVAVWEYSFIADSMSRSKNHDKLYGLAWQEKWDINTFLNATHPDDRIYSNEAIQKSVAPGGPDQYTFDFRVIYPDQTIHWLNVIGQVVERNAEGQGTIVRGTLIDITERKHAEIALREAQSQLTLAVQSANVGLWDWDLLTSKLYYSPEWKSQLGYQDHEISNDFSEWESRVHPEDLERAKETIRGYIEKPYPDFRNEFRLRHKDGSYRWILAQASLQYDERGRPVRMIGSHIDITERKQAEDMIRRERDFSEAALNSLPGVFYMYDEDRKFLRWNNNFETVTGYTSAEIARMSPLDFFAGKEKDLLAERIREVFEAGESHVEADFVSKDGRRTPYYFTWRTIQVGGTTCLIGVGIDITERKQAEAALRESEEKFSVIFEKAPFAATLSSLLDGAIEEVNEEFMNLFGFSRQEAVGRTSLELGLYPDPDVRRQAIARVQERSFGRSAELKLRSKSGEERIFMVNTDFVEIGSQKHVLTTAKDITDRKQAEETLRRKEQVLRLFVEHSPAAIAMFDRDMKYIVASRRYLVDYELGDQDLVGRSHYDVFPEIPERWKEIHRRCLAGAIERAEEDPFPRVSGKMDWIRWEIRPWYETNRETGGIILFSEVITERVNAEEEIRQHRDRLTQLSRRLVEVHETEQRAIGRELHDQVGQILTALKITLEIAPQLPPEQEAKKIVQAQELVDELLGRVSNLSLELRPPMLDDLGLIPALLWHINRYQEQSGIEVDFKHSGVEGKRFSSEVETTAYRIVQEALTNVARHAQATRVGLKVHVTGGHMEIRIEDNGKGFEPEAALAKNRGLSGMRERVHLLGGNFQIESQIGQGTKKVVQLPLQEGRS